MVFGVDLDDSTQQAFTASGDKVGGGGWGQRARGREKEKERERWSTKVGTFMSVITCLYPVVWLDGTTACVHMYTPIHTCEYYIYSHCESGECYPMGFPLG